MQIAAPECKWIMLPYKDKRRGGIWNCKACGKWGKGKKQPDCACKDITINKTTQ